MLSDLSEWTQYEKDRGPDFVPGGHACYTKQVEISVP